MGRANLVFCLVASMIWGKYHLTPSPMFLPMLSKSDFMKFLQCEKYLWLYKNRRDLLPEEVSEQQQAIFDQGFAVEDYAARLLPGARAQLVARAPWKAAGGGAVGGGSAQAMLYARADLVTHDEDSDTYDIYEVKSTTQVKPEHLPDLAFQKLAFQQAGYKIGKTAIVHLNNEYVRRGEIDARELLIIEDVTLDVDEMVKEIEPMIAEAISAMKKNAEPQVRIVKQCNNPYECPFIPYCWPQAHIPETNSVYDLTRISESLLVELLDRGIMRIEDMPEDIKLGKEQAAQVKVAKTGKPIIKKEKIRAALAALQYPLYFLDYETVNPAIPLWDGTRPYQQVCFQYSLHVLREPPKKGAKGKLEHFEYLAEGGDSRRAAGVVAAAPRNPVPGLLKQLKQDIAEDGGSVIVWYKSFEMGRNQEMAEMYPEYRDFLESVNGRVYDLRDIFKDLLYVHPDFRGSTSIKAVLPALVPELSYENLDDIREGTMAGLRWLQINFGAAGSTGVDRAGGTDEERARVRQNLLKYCERDTLAMVRVMGVLSAD